MDIESYIENYWSSILFTQREDDGVTMGLPRTGVMPNAHAFRNDQFYWDTYFINRALLLTEYAALVPGIVENFIYLFNRFGIIPSRNRYFNTGISQPPFLTSMVKDAYAFSGDRDFLRRGMTAAAGEYDSYWVNPEKVEKHVIHRGLSRYIDHYCLDLTAEHESGWDMTSRFGDRCLSYLPVDLNSLLYRYETDLRDYYGDIDDEEQSSHWQQRARQRKTTMNELMWDEKKGIFADYDYQNGNRSEFLSVAQFYPLWTGLATPEQASRTIENVLPRLRTPHGLANSTDQLLLPGGKRQWDHPNGWPNQQMIVVDALRSYGHEAEAILLMRDWNSLLESVFKKTGVLWEKYDVVNGTHGVDGHYPTQTGFGWTNASYLLFRKMLNDSITIG